MKRFFLTLIALAGCGCAAGMATLEQQRQHVTEAYAGCSPSEIVDRGRCDWVAVCAGTKYYCSACPPAMCEELK